jgi:predicted glycoside hydrolase/deacetylase ChbG (UPF0249 family)
VAAPRLLIVADDYGYAPAYDAGIIEAARAGGIDGAGAMVTRAPDPAALLATGIEVGLHLELERASLEEQLASFQALFGRPPAYLDGHHHCHAEAGRRALSVARLGARLGIPVRSVNPRHRRLLRCLGAPTADRLVGRLGQEEPPLPELLERWLATGEGPEGVTEWMVHPGVPDAATGSGYDSGRGEDLALLLELGDRKRWNRRGIARGAPGEVLGG